MEQSRPQIGAAEVPKYIPDPVTCACPSRETKKKKMGGLAIGVAAAADLGGMGTIWKLLHFYR